MELIYVVSKSVFSSVWQAEHVSQLLKTIDFTSDYLVRKLVSKNSKNSG